jgi:hypothetical protein
MSLLPLSLCHFVPLCLCASKKNPVFFISANVFFETEVIILSVVAGFAGPCALESR